MPRAQEDGWSIMESYWQVETVWPDGRIKEKIAYTNFFFAADAAYNAALVELKRERILMRKRARVMRRNWTEADGPLT
jgi:hypothetical protein